ncbi:MAG: hypothetical protein KC731_22990 [Myxococcales bacterium]|nr:hypothetical protein [Myxococcales bacterium]
MKKLVVALALLAACAPSATPTPTASLDEPKAPAVVPAEVASPSGDPFTREELDAQIGSPTRHPPLACRLRALLGDRAYALLEERGGYYPVADAGDGGITYRGQICPQPGCDGAVVWVRPDGAMVAAIESETIELFTNRDAFASHLPAAVQAFVDEVKQHGDKATHWAPRSSAIDPPVCHTEEVRTATTHYLEAQRGTRCDPEHSSFWASGVVVAPGYTPLGSPAEPATPSKVQIPQSDLVRLGKTHPDDAPWICVEHIGLDGDRQVGWLPAASLERLPDQDGDMTDVAERIAAKLPATPIAWLTGHPIQLSAATIRRLDATRLTIDLQTEMAGHLCGMEGELRETAARVFVDAGAGCGAVALLLDNGAFLWENGDCSGARATCTGPLLPAARR